MLITIVLLSLIILLIIGYISTPSAVLARAGSVSTSEAPKKPTITTREGKPISIKLSPFRGISYPNPVPDKKSIIWGKAIGNSMSPRGIDNGDLFLCHKDIDSIKHGDIVMIEIDGAVDIGGYKLREFNKFIDSSEEFLTYTYDEKGTKRESRPHKTKNLIGKVLYTAH